MMRVFSHPSHSGPMMPSKRFSAVFLVAFLVATASAQEKSAPLFSIDGDTAPYQITFSPDGKRVAVCSAYGQAHVFDLATRKPVSGAGHPKEIFSVQFDSSGDKLLTGSADTTMKLWDLSKKALVYRFEGHTGPVRSVAFSPNQKLVASGSYDKTVKLWDAETGKLATTLKGHEDEIRGIAFAPDGKTIASADHRGELRFWSVPAGELLRTAKCRSEIEGIAFTPDGKTVLAGLQSRDVALVDAATGKFTGKLVGHNSYVQSVAAHPTKPLYATGSLDKSVVVWDATTLESVAVFNTDQDVNAVAFSPRGDLIAAATNRGKIHVWKTPEPPAAVANARELAAKHPLAKLKVGDWVQFKAVQTFVGEKEMSNHNKRVSARTETALIIETWIDQDGQKKPSERDTDTINLTKPWGLSQRLPYGLNPPNLDVTRTEQRELKVGKTTFACTATTYDVWRPGSLARGVRTATLWHSTDGPWDGVVRQSMTGPDGPDSYELVAWGSKADTIPGPAAPFQPKAELNSLKMAMVPLKAGEAKLGIAQPLAMRRILGLSVLSAEEKLTTLATTPPKRKVPIENDFFIGAHEVTIGQFRQFVEATKYRTEAEKDGKGGTGLLDNGNFGEDLKFTWKNYGFDATDDCPVANVTWNDAQAFCKWLGEKEKATYRLPTEAEWEYACRAGTESAYFFGHVTAGYSKYGNGPDESLKKVQPKVTWAIDENDKYPYLAPVGSFLPNEWGLYDTHGNVIEWCQDRFDYYAPFGDSDDPRVPKETWYTHKGGSWFNQPGSERSHGRMGAPPGKRNSLIGFRVVREVGR